MECNWDIDLPWLPRDEQDFPLGAKATSYLPSATKFDGSHDTTELPDWMESQSNNIFEDVFNDIKIPGEMDCEASYQASNRLYDADEEYAGQIIKPEDMLVPLSELQPEKYTSQISEPQAPTLLAVSSIPKISVRVNKVKVTMPKQKQAAAAAAHQSLAIQGSYQVNHTQQLLNSRQSTGKIQTIDGPNYNTDELLNELVFLANKEPNILANMITSFESSIVQAGMNDLLSQLDCVDANQEMTEVTDWSVNPNLPVSVPSPVPSSGSLSPQSTGESFHQFSPKYTTLEAASHSEIGGDSFLCLLSPSSEDSLSLSSPVIVGSGAPSPVIVDDDNSPSVIVDDDNSPSPVIVDDYNSPSPFIVDDDNSPSPFIVDDSSPSPFVVDEESEIEYSQTKIHSYSRSPHKTKASRRSASRSGSTYPEGRKERKKEQNKQAALRYRQKKKQDDDEFMSKIKIEEERQKRLKTKYSKLKQELTYLKKIMREVFIANGTLSPEAFKK